MPSGMPGSTRAASEMLPRRVEMLSISPSAMPRRSNSPGASIATADGSSASSTFERRVIEPVCQCSSWRPVVSTVGYSASTGSSGGKGAASEKRARPLAVGKRSPNTTSSPGASFAGHGYVTEPSRSNRAQSMFASEAMPCPISAKTSRGWEYCQLSPKRRAISCVIHQSAFASPGSDTAARPICTCRLVLVTVPSFSDHAEAGRITSANCAVSVMKMSCTTRCSSPASAARA